jgi:hypothetical protein
MTRESVAYCGRIVGLAFNSTKILVNFCFLSLLFNSDDAFSGSHQSLSFNPWCFGLSIRRRTRTVTTGGSMSSILSGAMLGLIMASA